MNKTLIIFEMTPDSCSAYAVETTDAELKELQGINGLMVNVDELSEEQDAAHLKWQERITGLPAVKGSFSYDEKGAASQTDLPWPVEHVIFLGFAL